MRLQCNYSEVEAYRDMVERLKALSEMPAPRCSGSFQPLDDIHMATDREARVHRLGAQPGAEAIDRDPVEFLLDPYTSTSTSR
jgi:hypothetical protein